jgi:flagellar protein FliO/FliZ
MLLAAFQVSLLVTGWSTLAHASESSAALSPIDTDNLLQVAFGLGVVLLAILFASRVAKRLFRVPTGMTDQLKVVCGISMGARERVVLLQAGKTQLLLGVSPGRIQTLHVLDEPLTPGKEPLGEPSEFASRLTRLLSNKAAKRNA